MGCLFLAPSVCYYVKLVTGQVTGQRRPLLSSRHNCLQLYLDLPFFAFARLSSAMSDNSQAGYLRHQQRTELPNVVAREPNS